MKTKDWVTRLVLFGLITAAAWINLTPGGAPAPDVTFTTITGKQIDLKMLQGRPVIVTFWATDCPSCIKEIPHLIELYNRYHPQGLEIIAVAMYYDPPSHVVAMTRDKRVPYDVALDLKAEHAKAFGDVRRRNRQPGLRGRIAQARHVNGQERQHKGAELVQEGAEEQNPRAPRQRPQVLSQTGLWFVHRLTGARHRLPWANKKPTGLAAVGSIKPGAPGLRKLTPTAAVAPVNPDLALAPRRLAGHAGTGAAQHRGHRLRHRVHLSAGNIRYFLQGATTKADDWLRG